jgi:hypothetical protein
MDVQEIVSLGVVILAASFIGWRTYKSWTRQTDCGCNGCDVKKKFATVQSAKK